jgi:hypothetical protein
MAKKDNQSKSSDPGNAKGTTKASQAKRPKQLRHWKREHWNQYALEVGLSKEPEKQFKGTKELRSALKKAGLYPGQNGGAREGAGRE